MCRIKLLLKILFLGGKYFNYESRVVGYCVLLGIFVPLCVVVFVAAAAIVTVFALAAVVACFVT